MEREIEKQSLETMDSEPCKKEKRRLSVVTSTDCVNIPDETGSKSSLSKKYISSTLFSFVPMFYSVFRHREELLEELQKSLGPLTSPCTRNGCSPPTPPPTPHCEVPPSSSPPTFPRVNQEK